MTTKAAITVNRSPEEVQRLWASPEHRSEYLDGANAAVRFAAAPGDRGTEIHVELAADMPGGKPVEMMQKLVGMAPRAKAMDELRRFKQLVETGEIARSDAAPEGERAERKLKQRPAQPLSEPELQRVGV